VLYENAVSRYETFVSFSGFPAQLCFERRDRFIMSLDGGHAWESRAHFSDPMQNFHRYRETGLNIDDEERLFHGVIDSSTCNRYYASMWITRKVHNQRIEWSTFVGTSQVLDLGPVIRIDQIDHQDREGILFP